MKDVNLKEQLENAVEVFFDDVMANERKSLEFLLQQTIITTEESLYLNAHKFLSVLRQLFLFLPATFVLFFATVALTGKLIFPAGEGVLKVSFFQLIFLLGLTSLTVWGFGDLRNPKHFSVPLSIISVGVIIGIFGTVFFDWVGFGYFLHDYVPYFFPLALIISILTKSLADNSDEKDSI